MTGPSETEYEVMFNEADASPMPEAPRIGCCPSCDTALRTTGHRAKEGDFGVCAFCGALAIYMENGQTRTPTFDEAVEGESLPHVRFLLDNFAPEWRRTGRGAEDPAPEKDPVIDVGAGASLSSDANIQPTNPSELSGMLAAPDLAPGASP